MKYKDKTEKQLDGDPSCRGAPQRKFPNICGDPLTGSSGSLISEANIT